MSYEVHIYLANAVLSQGNEHNNYIIGNRHSLMLFIKKEKGSEYNDDYAQSIIKKRGWTDIVLVKSGTLLTVPSKEEFKEPYRDALENGSSMVVYSEPI